VWPPSGLSLPRTSVSALTFLDCRAYTATPRSLCIGFFCLPCVQIPLPPNVLAFASVFKPDYSK
jgi:hypothetical protein